MMIVMHHVMIMMTVMVDVRNMNIVHCFVNHLWGVVNVMITKLKMLSLFF